MPHCEKPARDSLHQGGLGVCAAAMYHFSSFLWLSRSMYQASRSNASYKSSGESRTLLPAKCCHSQWRVFASRTSVQPLGCRPQPGSLDGLRFTKQQFAPDMLASVKPPFFLCNRHLLESAASKSNTAVYISCLSIDGIDYNEVGANLSCCHNTTEKCILPFLLECQHALTRWDTCFLRALEQGKTKPQKPSLQFSGRSSSSNSR